MFFDLLPARAVLSDLNAELVTTYNVIKDKLNNLIDSLKKHENSKEYFLKIRSRDHSQLTDVQIALEGTHFLVRSVLTSNGY